MENERMPPCSTLLAGFRPEICQYSFIFQERSQSIPKSSSNRSKSLSRSNPSKSLSALPRDGFATRLGRPVGFSACPEWFAQACRSAEVQIV
jgi:hypothetical protein